MYEEMGTHLAMTLSKQCHIHRTSNLIVIGGSVSNAALIFSANMWQTNKDV